MREREERETENGTKVRKFAPKQEKSMYHGKTKKKEEKKEK